VTVPLLALAGCAESSDSPTPPPGETDVDGAATPTSPGTDVSGSSSASRSTRTVETSAASTDEPSPTNTTTSGLDLREANVTGVTVSGSGGTFDFDVTLYHDDDGEDGYANWWQVERLDGTRLGRRDLLHAHGTREFTRSATIEIPEGVTCVVVRGHDQVHGYGGQAALVNLDSGSTRFPGQGTDSNSFTSEDCP
jgi:hypothetical protein